MQMTTPLMPASSHPIHSSIKSTLTLDSPWLPFFFKSLPSCSLRHFCLLPHNQCWLFSPVLPSPFISSSPHINNLSAFIQLLQFSSITCLWTALNLTSVPGPADSLTFEKTVCWTMWLLDLGLPLVCPLCLSLADSGFSGAWLWVWLVLDCPYWFCDSALSLCSSLWSHCLGQWFCSYTVPTLLCILLTCLFISSVIIFCSYNKSSKTLFGFLNCLSVSNYL